VVEVDITRMRSGPKLVIDHTVFYQLISSRKFYSEVPAFHFMKEQGLAIAEQILQATLARETQCAGCNNLKQSVDPLFRAFGAELYKLQADSPEALTPLVTYISQKKGYRPMPIMLYYRTDDGIKTLKL
jgi:hypothetical protein